MERETEKERDIHFPSFGRPRTFPKYIVLLGPCIAQHQMAIAQHPATGLGPGYHSESRWVRGSVCGD